MITEGAALKKGRKRLARLLVLFRTEMVYAVATGSAGLYPASSSSSRSNCIKYVSHNSMSCFRTEHISFPVMTKQGGERGGKGRSNLLLSLDRALQEGLDSALEILHLLLLKPVQLGPERSPHVIEGDPGSVKLPLAIPNLGRHLVEPVLLRLALPLELFKCCPSLGEFQVCGMVRVESLLSLVEGEFDGPNDADVLLDRDAESQDVLLRLTLVQLLDADLKV